MEDEQEDSPHQGLLPSQIKPERALVHQLSEEFTQDDMKDIQILVLDKVKKSKATFYELIDELEADHGMDALSFLQQISEGPLAGRILEDGDSLRDVIEKYKEMIERLKRKMKFEQHKKDKYFQGRTKEMCKALEAMQSKSEFITGIELKGEQCVGKKSLAEEIAFYTDSVLIATTSHRGKRTVKDMCISTLHALYSHTASTLEGQWHKKEQQRAQFVESFHQKDFMMLETISEKLRELKQNTVLLLPNLEDIYANSDTGLSRALSKILQTRNKKVTVMWTVREQVPVESDGLQGNVLRLDVQPLPPEDMWKLFSSVFNEKSQLRLNDAEEQQVMKMCGKCSPFEIKALAKMLAEKKTSGVDCPLDETASVPILHAVVASLPRRLKKILMRLSAFFSVFNSKMVPDLVGNHANIKWEMSNLRKWFLIQESGMPSKISNFDDDDCLYCYHRKVLEFLCKAKSCGLDHKLREEVENALFDDFEQHSLVERYGYRLFATLDRNLVYLKKYFSCGRSVVTEGQDRKKVNIQVLLYIARLTCDENELSEYLAALDDNAVTKQDDVTAFHSGVERVVFLRDTGRSDEAVSLMEHLRMWRPKMESPQNCHILARYYSAEGHLQMDLAKKSGDRHGFDKALEWFDKSLEYFSLQKCLSETELWIAVTQQSLVLNSKGHVYYTLGLHEKAFQTHKEALSKLRKTVSLVWGREDFHHDIPEYLWNMGNCRFAEVKAKLRDKTTYSGAPCFLKLCREAVDLFGKALEVKKKLGFPDDIPAALCYRDKADVHRLLKEHIQADEDGCSAWEILKKREERPSKDFMQTLHILGMNQHAYGRNNKSEELTRQAYQKSEYYYRQLRTIICEHKLDFDEMAHLMSHIRGVNVKVLEKLNDHRVDKVKDFYEALEDKRLTEWLSTEGSPVTEICGIFSPENFVRQPKQLDKADSGFGDRSIDTAHAPPETESSEEDVKVFGHTSPAKRHVLKKQSEIDSAPRNLLQKQLEVDNYTADSSVESTEADFTHENTREPAPKRQLENQDKMPGAKKQDSGIGESIDEADVNDVPIS